MSRRQRSKEDEITSDDEDLTWRLEEEVHSQSLEIDSQSPEIVDFRGRSPGSAFTVTTQPESRGERHRSMEWKTWNGSRMLEDSLDIYGKRPVGLASLAVSASVLVEAEPRDWCGDWDTAYSIKGEGFPEQTLMFRASQEFQCCAFGSLQNIVIRDLDSQPIGRVCYKEKSWFRGKLALGIYAPVDLLVGTGEEFNNFGICSSPKFQLRNSEGEELFLVEYNKHLCSGESQFLIQNNDGSHDVAKILSKSQHGIRLRFSTKTSLTLKIILLGFCIGILHKDYKQEFQDGA
ncbi:unnamed protein product [Allacma fusca]|uniref:Phospholipid scramblase n=1 Tax=Allacma fusca TaxID=39272 RepID=A0A8J2JAL7_9HEXA|nr:unnamed protein product [Allacma fusca]